MNDLQIQIAASLWKSGKDTLEIARRLFPTGHWLVPINGEAIVYNHLHLIKEAAKPKTEGR